MQDSAAPSSDPVAVAIRSILVLGLVCAVFGLVFAVGLGYLNTYERFAPWFLGIGVVVWFGPGVVFVSCAYLMQRHSRGAATAALVTAVFQSACALALLVLSATAEPVSPVPIVLCVLWLIGLADCIRRLASARRFLRAGTQRTRGFEINPHGPRTVIPVADPGDGE